MWRRAAFAAGIYAELVPNVVIGAFLQFVYRDVVGLGGFEIAIAWVTSNVIKMVSIMVLARFLDTTHHNHAALLAGATLPAVLMYALCWSPPSALVGGAHSWALCLFLTVCLTCFGFFVSVITLCRATLLTDRFGVGERNSIAALEQIFITVGVFASMVVPPLIAGDGWEQMGKMGWQTGSTVAVAALLSALSVYNPLEKKDEDKVTIRGAPQSGMLKSLVTPFVELPPFRSLVLSHFCTQLGFNLIIATLPLSIKYLMAPMQHTTEVLGFELDSKAQVAVAQSLSQVVTLMSIPFWFNMTARGMRFAWRLGAVLYSVVLVAVWAFSSGTFYSFVVFQCTGAFACSGLFVIPNIMLAQVAEFDKRSTGKSRMGVLKGIFTNNMILASVAQGMISSAVLDAGGYEQPGDGIATVEQSDSALRALQLLTFGIPVAFMLLSTVFVSFFSATDEKVKIQ